MFSRFVSALLTLGLLGAPATGAFAADVAAAASAKQAADPQSARPASACPTLLKHTVPRLQDDAPQDLCQYAGKVVLVVNTASYCGFTHQYEGLEKLYERFRGRGLVVLGFPSNDFGQQEPGSSRQIADFCENTFGVRFPMFAKTRVAGSQSHPLFAALARDAGGAPRWNFHKYLLSREGNKAVAGFPSSIGPLDHRVVQAVESVLAEPQTWPR